VRVRSTKLEPVLRTYVDQAVAVEKAGLKVDFKGGRHLELPDELATIGPSSQ